MHVRWLIAPEDGPAELGQIIVCDGPAALDLHI